MKSKVGIHKFLLDAVVREYIKGQASNEWTTLKEIKKTMIQMFSLFCYKSTFKLNKIYKIP